MCFVRRSLTNITYFTSTQTVALTVFGISAGVIMTFTRRYKWLLFIGLCIRLVYAPLCTSLRIPIELTMSTVASAS